MFSQHWYRVAKLKPELREHAAIVRHQYRNQDWWIIRDSLTNRQHRLSAAAHFLVIRMDGNITTHALWEEAVAALGEDAPSQSEIIELLGRLHGADLLKSDVNPDSAELFQRYETQQGSRRRQAWTNPLFLRFSLFDPDRLLRYLLPLGYRVFNRKAMCLWLLVVLFGMLLAAANWAQLVAEVDSDTLAPGNLMLLLFIYPLMKLLHELGHGLAVKRWGGEVHDMGISLMVMLPVPYVDASAAAAFTEKGHRMIVGAVGIMIELLLASLALFVWLVVEPGVVRQVALNVMLIGGISTVFFNGNPLLKFDGYYVLADWIEIPNLAARSRRYLSQVVQTSLFGAKDGDRPAASTGEAAWFVCYGLGSVGYRVVILLLIALYLSGTFFIAGILLAAWVLVSQFAIPMAKSVSALRRLSRNPRTTLRAYGVSVAMLSVVSILLFAIPFPSVTNAEGVLWLAERSVVRAGTDCFIVATLQASGSQVSPGTPLIECSDPELLAEEKVLSAKIAALQREYRGFALREQVRRKMLADEMAALTAELDLTRDRIDALLIRSEVAGTFVIPDDIRLPGRFLKHGDIAGFVMSAEAMAVRTAVPQDRIGLIREDVESVAMRLASTPGRAYPTSVLRHMPAAATHLPSASLGALGGGALAVDTSDDAGTLLEEEAFLVDLALPEEMAPTRIGERVHVRFRHGSEGLARQWFRGIKLLLMRQINV